MSSMELNNPLCNTNDKNYLCSSAAILFRMIMNLQTRDGAMVVKFSKKKTFDV